ncbi:MAG: oligosaccharide flippase family protein [bacterium]|nr:oligosaccharide flippase family protein [bacterium]
MTESVNAGVGRRITRYGTILAISGALCHVLRLIYTVMAINVLGDEKFGRIEYFVEMAVIFTVLLDFGLEQTITREFARRKDRLSIELTSLLTYRMAATLIGATVMTGFLLAIAKPTHTVSIILSAAVYFTIVSMIMLVRAVCRSHEWLSMEGAANFLDKFLHIGTALILLRYYPSLPLLLLCYSLGAAASLIVYSTVLFRRVHLEPGRHIWRVGWSWQKHAVPIGLSAACVLLLHRQDTAMVNWIQGDAETGVYRAPYRFLEGLFLIPQVMAISAYPVFSKLFHEGRPFSKTAATLMRGLILMSLPMAVGGACLGHAMMLWLAPNLGLRGGDVFIVLVWSLPFIYVNFLLGAILNAADRQSLNFRASAWSMASNLILNIPAIYLWGALGASLMTVISQGLYTVMMLYHTRDFHFLQDARRYAAIAASCLIMALTIIWTPWNWIIEVLAGATVYFACVFILQGVSREEIRNLRKVFNR